VTHDPDTEHDLRPPSSRALLPSLHSVHAVNRGQREQEKMLALWPCFLGHRWHPYRDLLTGHLVLGCHTCGEFRDFTQLRDDQRGDGR